MEKISSADSWCREIDGRMDTECSISSLQLALRRVQGHFEVRVAMGYGAGEYLQGRRSRN